MDDEITSVPASEARVHLGEMLRRVRKGEHIVIEKGGIPTAALIDVADYEEYRRLKASQARTLPEGVLAEPAPDGFERMMRAAGGWKGIDIEKFKADSKASRRISRRPPVEF